VDGGVVIATKEEREQADHANPNFFGRADLEERGHACGHEQEAGAGECHVGDLSVERFLPVFHVVDVEVRCVAGVVTNDCLRAFSCRFDFLDGLNLLCGLANPNLAQFHRKAAVFGTR
jgi:hypothetical protein